MRSVILMSAIAISVAGCASQPPDTLPGDTGSTAEAESYFKDNVQPIFEANCSSCHANPNNNFGAPLFLGTSTSDYYDKLVSRKDFVGCDADNSLLLHKGADPRHPGVPLPADGKPSVRDWLQMEANARYGGHCATSPAATLPSRADQGTGTGNGTGTGTGTGAGTGAGPKQLTGADALKAFGDCMTLADWTSAGMPAVANQNTQFNDNNNVKCYHCHNNFETGHNAMPDPNNAAQVSTAFAQMRYMYSSFNLVTWTVDPTDGSFKDIVASNRWINKGAEKTTHPKYTLNANYVTSYQNWFKTAYTKWQTAQTTGKACTPDPAQ